MIDWLDFTVDIRHDPIPTGRIASISPDGEIEWQSPKRVGVRGSFDNQVWLRSQGGDGNGCATQLYVSGNPSKFLQGHNVFGSEDVCALASETVRKAGAALGIPFDLAVAQCAAGNINIKRIDITRSFAFANRTEVQAVLAALAVKSRSRRGRPETKGSTVYHGQSSRRWTVKFYCKADELEAGHKHRLPDQLKDSPISEFAENLLRAELTLRSNELAQLEITTGKQLTPFRIGKLYSDYFGRIEMHAQAFIPSDQIVGLKRCYRDTYLLWKSGVDPRTLMSRATFWRHRSELLRYGVDVSLPSEGRECNVIPLFRQVTGSPVSVPDWAYSQGLIFDPNRVGG